MLENVKLLRGHSEDTWIRGHGDIEYLSPCSHRLCSMLRTCIIGAKEIGVSSSHVAGLGVAWYLTLSTVAFSTA